MKERQRIKKGIQIGLFSLFLISFFGILLHVHKQDFRGKTVHKTCAVCLLQYNTTALSLAKTALELPLRPAQKLEREVRTPERTTLRNVPDRNNPNKAPPLLS